MKTLLIFLRRLIGWLVAGVACLMLLVSLLGILGGGGMWWSSSSKVADLESSASRLSLQRSWIENSPLGTTAPSPIHAAALNTFSNMNQLSLECARDEVMAGQVLLGIGLGCLLLGPLTLLLGMRMAS